MSNNVSKPKCSCGSSCCDSEQVKKKLMIDFLYLDLTVCERCQGTESNLDQAIDEVDRVLKAAGYEVQLNKINIITKDMAVKHRFLSSPTIRINGNDISLEVSETPCKDCGDLCGDTVDCRSWIYEGNEYSEPPKEMIVNSILKVVYGGDKDKPADQKEYELPQNLELFFEGLNR